MQFSLVDPVTNEILILPIPPQIMRVEIGTKVLTFDPISLGTIELPRGRMPIRFSLEGLLPGLNQSVPRRDSELSPDEIVKKFMDWSNSKGANGKKLRFIVTETDWNIPVFYPLFTPDYSGGAGDINYTLELTEWRDFVVKEVKPPTSGKKAVRETKPKPKSHTIKKGDTLWDIAKKYNKKGASWTELWAANKKNLKSGNPDKIFPGEKLTIPAAWLK